MKKKKVKEMVKKALRRVTEKSALEKAYKSDLGRAKGAFKPRFVGTSVQPREELVGKREFTPRSFAE